MVRGLGQGPVVLLLDWGLWVIGRLLPHPMPGLPHLAPHQKPGILWRYPGIWICGRDWDKTTKAPLFLYSFYFVMDLLHFFFHLCGVTNLFMWGPYWNSSDCIWCSLAPLGVSVCVELGYGQLIGLHWVVCQDDWWTLQLYQLSWVSVPSPLQGVCA